MTITAYPNGVSSFGIPVMGGGVPTTTGTYFFVDSTTGSNGNSGKDPKHAFATIDKAINSCTANKGDVIIVMPAHAETLTAAAGIDADVEGISIIGLGNGDNRPTITLGTTEACDVDLAADNVLVRNVRFNLNGIAAIAAGIDVDGAYVNMDDCEIYGGASAAQATVAINVGASSHGFRFGGRNAHIYNTGSGGAASAIRFQGVSNDINVEDAWIDGDFTAGALVSYDGTTAGTELLLRMKIERNRINNTSSGAPAWNFGATTVAATGIMADNYIGITGTAGGTLVGYSGNTRKFNNFICNAATTQGELLPAADGVAAT